MTMLGSDHTGVPPLPASTPAGLVVYPEACEYSFSVMIAQNVLVQSGVDGDGYDGRATVAYGCAVRQPLLSSPEPLLSAVRRLRTKGSGPGFATQDTAVILRR